MGRLTTDWPHIDTEEMAFEYTQCMIFEGSWQWYWSLSGGCKFREKLAVSKQAAQKFDGERFNLKKLSKLEVWKQYEIKIWNGFVAFENLSDSKDIHGAWKNIKENIRTSAEQRLGLYELKQHKPQFD